MRTLQRVGLSGQTTTTEPASHPGRARLTEKPMSEMVQFIHRSPRMSAQRQSIAALFGAATSQDSSSSKGHLNADRGAATQRVIGGTGAGRPEATVRCVVNGQIHGGAVEFGFDPGDTVEQLRQRAQQIMGPHAGLAQICSAQTPQVWLADNVQLANGTPYEAHFAQADAAAMNAKFVQPPPGGGGGGGGGGNGAGPTQDELDAAQGLAMLGGL